MVKFRMKGNCIGRLGHRLVGAVLFLAVASFACAQMDFPTYKGDNGRTGKSGNFLSSGPGIGVLNWYRPNFNDNIGRTIQMDNTQRPTPPPPPASYLGAPGPDYWSASGTWLGADQASSAGGFQPTDRANPADGVTYFAGATWPTAGNRVDITNASNASPIVITTAANHDLFTGDQVSITGVSGNTAADNNWTVTVLSPTTFSLNGSTGNGTYAGGGDIEHRSDYEYSECIASATGSDPRVPLKATDTLSVYTWTLRNPVAPFYENQKYAIYVYVPVGPTTVAGVQRFPQSKYVFEIDFSGGSMFDVVDATGGGWIRLGRGGLPTDTAFPCDGVTPITVKLFNTVPRDPATGVLTTNPSSSGDDLDLTKPRPLVYVDAVKAIPVVGYYIASPIVSQFNGAAGATIATVGVLNQYTVGFLNGNLRTAEQAVVSSWDFNTGNRRWSFSPIQEGTITKEIDDSVPPPTVVNFGFTAGTNNTDFRGTGYQVVNLGTQSLITPAAPTASVTYAPTLNPGSYDIYAWIPGDVATEAYAHQLEYDITEDGGVVQKIAVDQSGTTAKGWVRIGGRSFLNGSSAGNYLTVAVTNVSMDATHGDDGKNAYADAIRFVSPSDNTIYSTPVQTTALIRLTPGGPPTATPVVVFADRDGKIWCVSADGNGDGTTKVYWTYPSTRDPSIPLPPPGSPDTWLDPNLNAPTAGNPDWGGDGLNNTLLAEMPTRFGKSSPLIENIGGVDYLFIAAENGRVYCIDMAGRGDMTSAHYGTTHRVWTYPDDYPALRKPPIGSSNGSIAFGTNTLGPTLFVPSGAGDGRMYALDAVGTPATKTTTPRWTYPALIDPTLGDIETTPSIDFNKVYFGTNSKDGNSPGQFFALDWNTGAVSWTMATPTEPLTNFSGGPVTVDAASLGGGMPDTVFLSNDNRGLYALDAGTGALQWETYEPDGAIQQPLTFTVMNVFDTSGAAVPTEVLVAPQNNGKVSIWNAQTSNLNLNGGRFAGGYVTTTQPSTTPVAVGWNFMYFGDTAGYLYAFSNTAGSFPPGTTPPITPEEGPNGLDARQFTAATVRLIKKAAYDALNAGTMYYADAIDPSNAETRTSFEYGEDVYALLTHFPYQHAGAVQAPIVNFTAVVGGESKRVHFVQARMFPDAPTPDDPSSGYAVLDYKLQPLGPDALPPGDNGEFVAAFNTVDPSGAPVNYPAGGVAKLQVANPLALVVPSYAGGTQTVGNTNITNDPSGETLVNGNGTNKIYILGSGGTVSDGGTDTVNIGVVDRSLCQLLLGPGKGLPGVKVERHPLAWQTSPDAGKGSPLYPLDPTLFPGFEDLPVNFPNNSLDYPDMVPQDVIVTQNPNGNSANPVQGTVELTAPVAPDGTPITVANKDTRVLVPTPWLFAIHVPRFQPPNEKLGNDQNAPPPGSGTIPTGYTGEFYIYVDSTLDGTLNRPNTFVQTDSQTPATTAEAYRTLSIATSVSADRRLSVLTPTVDLGSLAEGVGYTPDAPGPSNALFDPWTTQYSQLFKPFIVANEGNVNLLNLRLAKATTTNNTTSDAWAIFSPANEDWAYLDGSYDLWSDMDPKFAPMRDVSPDGMVIAQKARVGDRSARQVTTNPVARPNPNTGIVTNSPRLPASTYPVQAPRVGVTVPFGFPVGTYVGLLKVIEDDVPGSNAASMWQNLDGSGNPTEANSEPGLRITFKPREARVTSAPSALDAPFFEDFGSATPFRFGNLQPSGFRNPTNGSLVVAMASNRPLWAPPAPSNAVTDQPWRIYLGAVQGADPKTAAGTSPLRDLQAFVPDTANNRWFHQAPVTSNGFPDPTQDSNIWPNRVGNTARYGSPVFPTNGMVDPFPAGGVGTGAPFPNSLMAFVGDARVGTQAESTNLSEIFVAPVTVDNSGSVGIGNAYAMTNDSTAEKGRPSIVQTQNGFVLFYAATVGGRSSIYFVLPSGTAGANQYDGSYFTNSSAINLGEGFESVSSPSATGRLYRGANKVNSAGDPIIELTFVGKIHGRNVPEVFYTRIALDNNDVPTGLMALPVRTREQVFQSSQPDTYLADGVDWVATSPITLEVLRNGTYTDIEVPNTRLIERGTGIVTFDTKLGGKAYLDPVMGTVRLSGSNPPNDASLVLTYQPKVLRISEGTSAGYASPNTAFDDRYIPNMTYWRRGGDGSPIDSTDAVRTGRYLFTYGRAAAGGNQAARPMMKSMRLGVDLPLPVFTNSDGSTGAISVAASSGSIQYYQIDPAKKKIYFTPDDEDRTVTITYEAADPTTGADVGQRTVTAAVQMIQERPEELVQLDQATNEQNLFMFLDPFDYQDFPRPGLVWLLWSSTRAGTPDVYMETIAPRFTPIITGK